MDNALTLNRRQRRTALLMALLGAVVPVVLAVLSTLGEHSAPFLVGAAVAAVAPLLANVATGRWRPAGVALRMLSIPALTLMQAGTGGVASPHALLLVMAMLYLALRCTTRQMVAGFVLTVACCYLPMIVVGDPWYPVAFLQATELLLVLGAVTVSFAFVSREAWSLTRKLNRQASIDPLTRLLNRRGWEEEVARARATHAPLPWVVVLLDLDGLKQANDTHGHDAGDALIRDTGRRLRECVRTEDVVARLGGDEFAVHLLGIDAETVRAMLARLRTSTPAPGGFSSGIAVAAPHERLAQTMRRADLALYEAKSAGRSRDQVAPVPAPVPAPGGAAATRGPGSSTAHHQQRATT